VSKEKANTPDSKDEKAKANSPADPPGGWPLQADRLAIHTPLIDCLQILAGHYGRRTSPASLMAGLPVPKEGGITPALFIRAAERADLHAVIADRNLESLAIAPNLPCILALEHGQACILWAIKYPSKHAPKKEEGKDVEIHPETRFMVQFA
jgi:ATP-binding cassette subfamily C protein LapB